LLFDKLVLQQNFVPENHILGTDCEPHRPENHGDFIASELLQFLARCQQHFYYQKNLTLLLEIVAGNKSHNR
jgi:hypothetical protein